MNLPLNRGGCSPYIVDFRPFLIFLLTIFSLAILSTAALAHAVAEGDKGYIQEISGDQHPAVHLSRRQAHGDRLRPPPVPVRRDLLPLPAEGHRRSTSRLFAIGHSTTMLLGVYFNIGINSYLIDAIIGLSVVYKALDNLGAFQRWFGFQPNTKAATLIFGLFHGFGLATKILDYEIAPDGLVPNLLAFNVGVEIGQLLALAAILIVMGYWRRTDSFWRHAYTANVVMMTRRLRADRLSAHRLFRLLNIRRRIRPCTTPTCPPAPSCPPRRSCCAPPSSPSSPPPPSWSPSCCRRNTASTRPASAGRWA